MRERVNSPRDLRGVGRLAVAFAALALTLPARAQPPRERPLLFGGGPIPEKAPVQRDPWLPTGARVPSAPDRPGDVEPPGCSFRYPVCVHRGAGVSETAAAQALVALEGAYQRLVHVLGLPAPAWDAGRGGSDALDLYLSVEPARLEVEAEPIVTGRFDRAAAFCRVGPVPSSRDATLCVGEAIALALDPAETPHLRRAYATHLWHLGAPPVSADLEAIDDVQALTDDERRTLIDWIDQGLARQKAGEADWLVAGTPPAAKARRTTGSSSWARGGTGRLCRRASQRS